MESKLEKKLIIKHENDYSILQHGETHFKIGKLSGGTQHIANFEDELQTETRQGKELNELLVSDGVKLAFEP